MMFRIPILLLAVLILGVFACGNEAGNVDQNPAPEENEIAIDDSQAVERPEMVYASHILIPFQGCQHAPDNALSREEARNLLSLISDSISSGQITFEEAAVKHSTCPSSEQGGSLGGFTRGQMVPEFENVAFALEPGAVSEIFETAYGFHIVLRQPTVQASHILLAFEGAERSTATRTQEEALELIESLQDSISAGAMTFADAAAQYSDCPSSADGGNLGPFPRNVMSPAFEEAAFSLEAGDMSGIVETPFGYHLILRTE